MSLQYPAYFPSQVKRILTLEIAQIKITNKNIAMTNILFTKKNSGSLEIVKTISKTHVAFNIHALSLKWRIVPTHVTLDFHVCLMLMILVLIPPFLAVTFMY